LRYKQFVLSPDLLAILVCPKSKAPLKLVEGFLLCATSRLKYRIDNDVPVLLVDEAQALTQAEVDALV
jgi:hypothetical protein